MDRTDLRRDSPGSRPPAGSPSAADIEQALWRDFAEASTPQAFYRSWLALQCRLVPGAVSAVIVLGEPGSGSYAPAASWPEGRRGYRALAEVAEKALVERQGIVVPRARPDVEAGVRGRYDVAYPIEFGGALHGVVAIEVAPRDERDVHAVLRRLQWGAAWLEALALREEVGRAHAVRDRLRSVLDLAASAFGHERFYAAALAFVTAVATRLHCDRVTLGFVTGGRVRLRAMSHNARFGKQTTLVRAIEHAMDEAVDQHATIVQPPLEDRAVVVRAHGELSRLHGAGAICTVPLVEGERIYGALTLERPADAPFSAGEVELCEALGGLAGPALERHRREDRWLLRKIVDAAGGAVGRVVGPRHLGLKAALAAAAALVAFLVLADGEFRVSADAVLEPVVRRAAVAPFNGYVAEAPVRAGDLVREGQPLARLDDRDMRLDRLKWLSQQEQLVRQYHQAMAQRNAAQVMILSSQIDQAKAEVALLDEQLARTRLVAPFDAIVVTGDLSQSLGAPVERGQVLYELAPLDAFRVMLRVDERDVTSVRAGQRGTLLLTGAPAQGLPLTVQKITPVSVSEDGRNYFRVEAQLDEKLDRLRPGMEGVGKIEAGRARLVWIWTRSIIDWVRLELWRWMP
jgi:RND family efflux transporter MFP subunit